MGEEGELFTKPWGLKIAQPGHGSLSRCPCPALPCWQGSTACQSFTSHCKESLWPGLSTPLGALRGNATCLPQAFEWQFLSGLVHEQGTQTIHLCMGHATVWEALEGRASLASPYPCLDPRLWSCLSLLALRNFSFYTFSSAGCDILSMQHAKTKLSSNLLLHFSD